jgi:hypothetical protein
LLRSGDTSSGLRLLARTAWSDVLDFQNDLGQVWLAKVVQILLDLWSDFIPRVSGFTYWLPASVLVFETPELIADGICGVAPRAGGFFEPYALREIHFNSSPS